MDAGSWGAMELLGGLDALSPDCHGKTGAEGEDLQ